MSILKALPKNNNVIIMHNFDRSLIEQKDYSFLDRHEDFYYNSKFLSTEELQAVRGKVYFSINGYGNDKRELCNIPEVVEWLEGLWQKWDEFMFFVKPVKESVIFGFIDLAGKSELTGDMIANRYMIFCHGENKIIDDNGMKDKWLKWQEKHDRDFVNGLKEITKLQ